MEAEEKRNSIMELIPDTDNQSLLEEAVQDLIASDETKDAKHRADQLLSLRTKRARPTRDATKPANKVEDILPTKPSESAAVQQAVSVLRSQKPSSTKPVATTRESVARLMNALNIDLDLQLTKNDTATLLSCLLTANDTQLQALYNNKRIPVAIKTVIKRLQDDVKTGNMETIERLWDRLFGRNPMTESVTTQTGGLSTGPSLIPNGPVSRETYILIKEQLMGS